MPQPQPEPDKGAPTIKLRSIRRKARRDGKRAGRAAARGRPHSAVMEQLPGRVWVTEVFEQHMQSIQVFLGDRRREVLENLEVTNERIRESEKELSRNEALVNRLTPQWEVERQKPRTEQNLELEHDLHSARDAVTRAREEKHEQELVRERLDETLKHVEEEMQSRPLLAKETCDAVLVEHDTAYERAEHSFVQTLITRVSFSRSSKSPAKSSSGAVED